MDPKSNKYDVLIKRPGRTQGFRENAVVHAKGLQGLLAATDGS